jgi:hypothetical protein
VISFTAIDLPPVQKDAHDNDLFPVLIARIKNYEVILLESVFLKVENNKRNTTNKGTANSDSEPTYTILNRVERYS